MQALDSSQQTHYDYRELLESTVLFPSDIPPCIVYGPRAMHRGWWMTKLLYCVCVHILGILTAIQNNSSQLGVEI